MDDPRPWRVQMGHAMAWDIPNSKWNGGFHGGTLSQHPFWLSLTKTIQLLGYPHDYGNPQMNHKPCCWPSDSQQKSIDCPPSEAARQESNRWPMRQCAMAKLSKVRAMISKWFRLSQLSLAWGKHTKRSGTFMVFHGKMIKTKSLFHFYQANWLVKAGLVITRVWCQFKRNVSRLGVNIRDNHPKIMLGVYGVDIMLWFNVICMYVYIYIYICIYIYVYVYMYVM